MKHTLLNSRTLFGVMLLLISLTACKKGPIIWGYGCPAIPSCQVEQKLMFLEVNGSYQQLDFPKIRKTFAADGTVNYLEASIPPFAPIGGEKHSLNVSYAGKSVYLVNSTTHDTTLSAKLDPCGKVTQSTYRTYVIFPQGEYHETITNYTYDANDRLSKMTCNFNSQLLTLHFRYDSYGNLIKFFWENDPSKYIEFIYDYTRPIKGASYDFEGNVPMQGMMMMATLGHVDFPAHHLLKKIRDYGEYPFDNRDYSNQVINAAGYVTSYDYTFFSGGNKARNITTWRCSGGGSGHPKY
jgi:hypothetical protein